MNTPATRTASPRLPVNSIHLLALVAFASFKLFARTHVTDLQCESLENPLGIDRTTPRLSWIIESPERGQYQTAYQILVATTPADLTEGKADLWDSGKVASRESIQIPYAGEVLGSYDACHWKVRIWDRTDQASSWSKAAEWSMGLLEPADWQGTWIGKEERAAASALGAAQWIWFPEGSPRTAVPPETRFFRCSFTIPADRIIRSATLLITADNECAVHVNGSKVGEHSGFSMVKMVDVKGSLKPGNNLLAVSARNHGPNPNPAGLICAVRIEFERQAPLLILTDSSWKCANEEQSGWMSEEFDDSDWPNATTLGPVGTQPWGDVSQPEDRRLAARYLRKDFLVDKKVRRATVSFSGLGLSELYLNGSRVGDAVLSPALTEYPKRVFYVTHDVTGQLKRGKNAIGVILGNGRFYAPRGGHPSYGWPKLLLQLRMENADGSISTLVSDESWRLSDRGPIRANNEFDGEEYDARLEFEGWMQAGFDDSAWPHAQRMPAPGGTLSAQMMEPIRVVETLKPVGLTESEPGVYIVDMGQNMVGWCRIKVRGPAGTRIELRHAETLKPDGTLYVANLRSAKATDSYTLNGSGTEIWEPRFTYHGFRYVEVRGWPGRPRLSAIEGRVVHDDLRRTGEFVSSNPLLNQIYWNAFWGIRGNYRSIPTDCPQRDERQGWLGDRGEVSRGSTYLFDLAAFQEKWLQDISDAQRESGSISDVSPAYWQLYNDNVTWPSTAILIPNTLLRQYGDTYIVTRQYDSMKRWVEHMLGYMEDGLISRDSYGDWCVPPEEPELIHSQDPARKTDKTLLASAYFYNDLRLMERYAEVLGNGEDARRWRGLADQLAAAFNARFLNREAGCYDNGTQTSCVLPLYFGLVPEDMEDAIFQTLVHAIIGSERQVHIGTGLVGAQFLNRVLSDHGRADLAYAIATQEDYPGWGYMVKQGATTIWELWNGDTADPSMNSGNHVMLLGDLVTWLYEYLAGIRPDDARPGFKHIIMNPHPVGDLTFVTASHVSPYGMIRSAWRKDGDDFDWKITVPVNTLATVHIPATSLGRVQEGGKRLDKIESIDVVDSRPNHVVVNVGSGDYHFRSSSSVTDQPGVKEAEFIFEKAPYPSCHASTVAETTSGTLVAAWFGGTRERHPDVGIWVSRHQHGKWTTPMEVANGVESPEIRYPTWNPVLFQPDEGPLLLFYKVGPTPRDWWGMRMESFDDGKTWSKPIRLPDGILGPIKNKPIQLDNGDILSPSSTEDNGWQVHFERSTDGGETWTSTGPVNDPERIRAIQPSLLDHGDGRLQALGRTRYSGVFSIWSTDNGYTWGEMGVLELPNPSSGTDAVTLTDGRQLLVYNHNTREATLNKGRSPLNVAVSEDGTSWFAALVLEDDPTAPNGFPYPAVIQTGDGLVHVTYTWERKRIKHVVIDPTQLELKPIVDGKWPD